MNDSDATIEVDRENDNYEKMKEILIGMLDNKSNLLVLNSNEKLNLLYH